MSYKEQKFGISTTRRNYKKETHELPVVDLLAIQKEGFEKFIEEGFKSVFEEVYPVHSTKDKITVEYVSSKIELPKNPEKAIKEAKDKGSNYSGTIRAKFKMINNLDGTVKSSEAFIVNLPLMTDGGSFIINGSERVIISQIIRAPGAYYENMKASRSQASSEASISKVATVIPARGSWVEYEYKDYKLLNTNPGDIKMRIDKSKRIRAALLLFGLGLAHPDGPAGNPDIDSILQLFNQNELVVESIKKIKKTEYEPHQARASIFRSVNTGERATKQSVDGLLSNLLFNRQRYDLSETGRYKLSKKLNPTARILNRVLVEDVKTKSGRVIASAGTLVDREVAEKIETEWSKNNIKLSNLSIDETVLGRMLPELKTPEEKDLFTQVVIIKVYKELDAKKLIKAGKEPTAVNVISTTKTDYKHLTISDLISSFGYMINVEEGLVKYDDIDSLENRKIRNIDELLRNQFRIGLTRIARNLRDRISQKDTSNVTVKNATNHKLMESAMKEFFNSSQLSQFMDQINPLAEISNKRRITSLGPGGLSRDTASLAVRGIHDSHYGRIDPIETPEGPNIGLILNLAMYARVNKYGLIEAPYYKVVDGVINYKDPVYLTADEEQNHFIAAGNTRTNDGRIADKEVVARHNSKFVSVPRKEITLIDVSTRQTVSIATSHIPFLENDDTTRALMGANMQRQAVPLIKAEAPIVATGSEQDAAKYSPTTVKAEEAGKVIEVNSKRIIVAQEGDKKKIYDLAKFIRSNQGSGINQRPRVKLGQRVKKGDILADGPSVDNGELAIGKNVVIAFTAWRGYNYEDAIIISERLVKDDVYTSVHVEEHVIEQRTTKLGDEEITSDIPNASKEAMRHLDSTGIIVPGAEVKVGDVLVGKITPKGDDDLSAEEKLLDAILGNKSKNTRDTSLKVPYGAAGVVHDVKILSKENGDKLDDGVEKIVKVYIAQKRKLKEGDKMSGRHGNKGVVSKVLPVEDMPYLEDGTPVDVMLNPLGVPSRMNIGQVLEIHLGMAAKQLGIKVATPIFNGASADDLKKILKEAKIDESGKYTLYDGMTGEPFENKVAVGVMYMLKLSHMIDDKMHARSIGPYSLITQQPLRGKSQNGGQRFGEMEAWALEAYGASNLLQEMSTLKSDDIKGRNELYNAIAKGKRLPTPSVPEGLWVLYYELRGLGLKLGFKDKDNKEVEIDNKI